MLPATYLTDLVIWVFPQFSKTVWPYTKQLYFQRVIYFLWNREFSPKRLLLVITQFRPPACFLPI